jgi:hypothetical protein
MAINALKGLLGGKGRFGRESASRGRRRRLYRSVNLGSSAPHGFKKVLSLFNIDVNTQADKWGDALGCAGIGK